MSNFASSISLPPKVVRASAGTGKTFQLSSRYLQLILLGEQPDKILATTFTKKAAGEIRERILQRLVTAASSNQQTNQLGIELAIPYLKLDTVNTTLKKFIAFQHRLQICTLDSFFVSLAKSFSSELELPASWRILDPLANVEFIDEAVKDLCSDQQVLIELLNLLQNNHGARKIHGVLVEQVTKLQELVYLSSRESWNCDFLTKPPRESELAEAIKALPNFPIPQSKSGKPNLNYQKALLKITDLINGSGYWEARVLSDGGALFDKIILGEPATYYQADIPEELFVLFKPICQQVRFKILTRINQQTKALRILMDKLVVLYEAHRNAASAVSFDDLKRKIFKASIANNLVEMYFRIDTKINHLLLDEFQDTSLAEWVLLEPIADEVLAHADETHSFFCVGDTKQAIYGFRGGVAEIFDQLESRWAHLATERLEVSRRSSQIVLDFINLIFDNIKDNPTLARFPEAGKRWQQRFDSHSAYHQDLPGFVSLVDVGEISPIKIMAEEVLQLYQANPKITIGVLVRGGKGLAECLYELKKLGIPASGEGGSALIDSPVVVTLLSFLWLVDHPADTIAHFHVASSPLADILGVTKSDSLAQRDLIGKIFRNKLLDQSLSEIISDLVSRLESVSSQRDRSKLQQLVNATMNFNQGQQTRLSKFVEYVRRLKVPDPEQSPVKVMTIHKSKGLEFDAVFLADLDYEISRSRPKSVVTYQDSTFEAPSRVIVNIKEKLRIVHPALEYPYQQLKIAEAVDALSLLYVALTRARHALYVFVDTNNSRATVGKLVANCNQSIIEKNETKKKKDDSEVIQVAKLLYSAGDQNWQQLVKQEATQVKPVEIVSLEIFFAEEQALGKRNIPRITPSKTKTKVQFRGHSPEGRKARDKGTVLHKLFEGIEWSDTIDLKNQQKLADFQHWSTSNPLIPEAEIKEAIRFFQYRIQDPKIKNIFEKSNYDCWESQLKLERERRFTVITPKGLNVGIIDRLVLGLQEKKVKYAEIIDFKSDLQPAKHQQFHQEQIESYREAVCAMYNIPVKQVSCKLVYLETLEIKIIR